MDTVKNFSYSLLISSALHILPLLGLLVFSSTQKKIEHNKVIEISFQTPPLNRTSLPQKKKKSGVGSSPLSTEGNSVSGQNESHTFPYDSETSQKIKGHLNISYPRIARERGLEGRVFLIVELTNQGKIKEINVDPNKSTAHQILINEVIQALHKGQIGPISSTDGIKTEIVIDFKLEN